MCRDREVDFKDFYMHVAMFIGKKGAPIFHLNMSVISPFEITAIKVDFYTVKNGTKKLILTKKVEEPCHTAYLKLLTSLQVFRFKPNIKACILTKSTYTIELNFTELTRQLLSNSFYYGEYYVRSFLYGKSKPVACVILRSLFKKI
ncbi:hypothetical protein NE865_11130 [Phthorimaea operculella]|nr:hypothetical protein NE865_11130 [Phthorimaea operculella]